MSSGFISETEVLEARRRRQEEWEKVRTEDQPREAPDEPYDSRPLYQRLEEQRMKKEAEFEEAHKLKNMIRGLDDDEVGFLDLVERSKAKAAQQISIEEQREMQEFRERVSNLTESEEMTRLRAQLAPARNTQTSQNTQSQKNKLQGVIVRKRKASEKDEEHQKESPESKRNGFSADKNSGQINGSVANVVRKAGGLRCAGVLPGLGDYQSDTTSDSASSSDSEISDRCCVKRDLLGRLPEGHSDSKSRKEETRQDNS